jgi:hypothetical protein
MISILKTREHENSLRKQQAEPFNSSDRTIESVIEEAQLQQIRIAGSGGDSRSIDMSPPPDPVSTPKPKRRIWFRGKVTTHVQEFDKKKPACSVNRLLLRGGSHSRLTTGSTSNAGLIAAPLTPTRWEGSHTRESQRTGRRGTLMPFMPTRRRSSDESSSEDGRSARTAADGTSRRGRMKDAAACIEDPSAPLRRDSAFAAVALHRSNSLDASPRAPRRLGMAVVVAPRMPRAPPLCTPFNETKVGSDTPRQPVRRSSSVDREAAQQALVDIGKATKISAAGRREDPDESFSSTHEDDMRALEQSAKKIGIPSKPRVAASASPSSRRWSLELLPPSPSGGGGRRWSLNAPPTASSTVVVTATSPEKGKRRWTWNTSRRPSHRTTEEN